MERLIRKGRAVLDTFELDARRLIMGSVAGIGFTVALFVSGAAYGPGEIQNASKLGALFSLGSIIPAVIMAKIFGVQRVETDS